MSCLGLKRQLLHTKKVLKKSTSEFQSKLPKLKTLKRLKSAAAHLNTIFGRRNTNQSLHHPHRHEICPKKLHRHRSCKPVYVDELYNQQQMPAVHVMLIKAVPDYLKEAKEIEDVAAKDYFEFMINEATPSSHPLAGNTPNVVGEMGEVDIRAEIFISKFKKEMRLQRQRSFNEYQEMLARGV